MVFLSRGSLLVASPNFFKIEHEPLDRSGTGYGKSGLDAGSAVRLVNVNLSRVRVDQPTYFDAVGNPVFHLLRRLGQAVALRSEFDDKSRRETQKVSQIVARQPFQL